MLKSFLEISTVDALMASDDFLLFIYTRGRIPTIDPIAGSTVLLAYDSTKTALAIESTDICNYIVRRIDRINGN